MQFTPKEAFEQQQGVSNLYDRKSFTYGQTPTSGPSEEGPLVNAGSRQKRSPSQAAVHLPVKIRTQFSLARPRRPLAQAAPAACVRLCQRLRPAARL
ncbi:hypothetical protein E1301_Tti015502 [Triplophysa tibetana]|uniref:Uncharacterized protein n=1 Tax=Triplophysa tibetana TaxID=1572043 RepID=A0A5A9N0U1_9TELE|nr:hypothetical protein E1301_Tti015502 [Triplophysa tibetana]